jgi:predicted dehydrogenase
MEAVGNIEVSAISDLRQEARDSFMQAWASRWPGMRAFSRVDEMLAEPLDLVSVVTPDHLHTPMIQRCIDAGVPMVFTEKPFTTDLGDADKLLELIERAGMTVSVNHTWRWRPEVVEAKALVASGRLGPLSQVSIEAGGPRAMLFRNLSHFIDLAIHIADAEPEWVVGELEAGNGDYGLHYSGDGGSDPALDPGAWMTIGFSDGVRGHVSGLKASPADVSIQVQCRDGRITIDALGARVVENPRTNDGTPASVGGPAIRPLKPRFTRSGMEAGLADLIDSHRRGVPSTGSAQSARETVAVIDAVLRANHLGSRVNVPRRPSV